VGVKAQRIAPYANLHIPAHLHRFLPICRIRKQVKGIHVRRNALRLLTPYTLCQERIPYHMPSFMYGTERKTGAMRPIISLLFPLQLRLGVVRIPAQVGALCIS
jgi:hypothetical protein